MGLPRMKGAKRENKIVAAKGRMLENQVIGSSYWVGRDRLLKLLVNGGCRLMLKVRICGDPD